MKKFPFYPLLLALLLFSQTILADLGKVTGYQTASMPSSASGVIVTCEKGQLVIQSYAAHGWKITALPAGMTMADERPSIALTGEDCARQQVTVTQDDKTLILSSGNSAVHVDKATATVSFYDHGRLCLAESEGIENATQTKSIHFAPQHEAAFYGGGYNGRMGNLDGQAVTMNNTQNYGWDQGLQGPNNICVPFIVSTNGYGILFEDHYINARIHPSSTGGTRYESDSPTPISYVYVGSEDGTMAGVMHTYSRLTGRHELPPYWALGYISSRYGYHGEKETREVVASFKSAKMPISGLVLDLFWEGEKSNGMGNLDWYKPMWPNARKMLGDLKRQGIHTVIITEPYFAEETTNYQPLLQQGLFADPTCPNMGWVSDRKVGIIDFMTPKAMDWMWQFYQSRTDEGVDGWWLDLGEPEMISDGITHADGSTHAQAHNEFGQKWIEGVWKRWKQSYPDRRPFLVPRSGSSGMHRYATYPWTGDIARSWSGLRCQVPALIHGGMSGLGYLSSDIGGFAAGEEQEGRIVNPELYLRWFQLGVFSPILRTHSTYLPEPYQPEYQAYRDRLRELMNLRYRLLPYLYSAAWRNTSLGTPITAPLSFYDAEAKDIADIQDEYLFGPNILVAPIMEEGQTGRKVTLPRGEWVDPISGELFGKQDGNATGATTIQFHSSDLRIPFFVRRGSFTPLLSQTSFTSTDDIDHSALTIYYPMARDKALDFTIYDDDKVSSQVADRYELLTLSAAELPTAHAIDITTTCPATYAGRPASRRISFQIPLCHKPVINATSETLIVSQLHYDEQKGTVTFTVELPSSTGNAKHRILLNYES